MRNLLVLFLVLCLCIFIGCLGVGGGGGSLGGGGSPYSAALLTGRVYFAERQLYGGIPVAAYDMSGKKVETVLTDSNGYFAFSTLPAGVYNLAALTGESEVVFSRSVQIDGVSLKEINETSLLAITEVVIDEISSSSFNLQFKSNRASRASVEYGPLGGYQQTVTIGQAGFTSHEITLSGLRALNDYEATIYLTGDDGQDFIMRGLYVGTTGAVGPTNLSVAINEGDYETKSQNVTLNLNADNCTHMRISENFDMGDATWVTYSQTYSYNLQTTSAGTRRVYVQFRDTDGVTSPIQSDAILMSKSGYVGIWINDGEATTSKTDAVLRIIFPGATHMQLSNSSDFFNSFWEIYAETKKWKFSSVDGLKTIYCKFKGGNANSEDIFTASILLDTTPPSVEMKINNENKVTATTSVTISFDFSVPPSQMKIANTSAPATSASWIAFTDTLNWTLPVDDGEKEVFAIFRDGAGNEYGPISAKIELDTVAPLGNTIALKLTEDAASELATFTLTASLPIFLHFDVTDESTYQAHYSITAATTTPPVSSTTIGQPFTPVALDATALAVGTHKIWTVFSDQAGNTGYYQTTSVKVDGPQIIVSPETTTLKSGQTQQFTATLKNISSEEVGTVRWRVIDGSGTIDANGLFTAPSPVYYSTTSTIRADSTVVSNLLTQVSVNLATSVEMLFQQRDGEFDYKEISDIQVAPGDVITARIQMLHSTQGIEIIKRPVAGVATITSEVYTPPIGTDITLTYTAPSTEQNNPQIIGIQSLEDKSVVGTISYIVSTGTKIIIDPTECEAQRNTTATITAELSDPNIRQINWIITPPNLGSFLPGDSPLTAITTESPNHIITFYASSTSEAKQASVTAYVDGASASCNITILPPIDFVITPDHVYALPVVEAITFKVEGVSNLIGNATSAVDWFYKNADAPDFRHADGKNFPDSGILTIINESTAEYRRPTTAPSAGNGIYRSNDVIIKAVSLADTESYSLATVTISPDVKVTIYDELPTTNSDPVASVTVVAEVGKKRFYAIVTPDEIVNTSVSWSINSDATVEQTGTIDANGLYSAPAEIIYNKVVVRATSNYDTSAYSEATVNLTEFWIQKRDNMIDSVSSQPIPITALLIDPNKSGDFKVYAGTDGYGIWEATFDEYGTGGGEWAPMSGSGLTSRGAAKDYINQLVIASDSTIYATTNGGIYYTGISGLTALDWDSGVYDETHPSLKASNTLAVEYYELGSVKFLFATTPRGLFKIELINKATVATCTKIVDTFTSYHYPEDRASGTESVTEWSYELQENPINQILYACAYDKLIDRVYAGGGAGAFFYKNDTDEQNILYFASSTGTIHNYGWAGLNGLATTTLVTFYGLNKIEYLPRLGPIAGGLIRDIAIDPVNTNTLWAATVGGVYRSVDEGMTWTSSAFTVGSNVNTRTILIDPTNTINVLAGSEDGLYRSTNAGTNWTRVKSGLGEHKTITSLIQAPGQAGVRRKVWVGTAGGVFMGKQSLDLE